MDVDPWLPRSNGFRPVGVSSERVGLKVCDVIDAAQHVWKMVIDAIMQEEDAKAVRLIPLPCSDMEDQWVWHFSNRGIYSVSSGYESALRLTRQGLAQGITGGESSMRDDDKKVWNKSSPLGYVPSMNGQASILAWFDCLIDRWKGTYDGGYMLTLAAMIMWRIWKCRNEVLFNGANSNLSQMVVVAIKEAEEFILAMREQNPEPRQPRMGSGELAPCWQKPTCGKLKFNVDGAWVSRSDELAKAGAGMVVRDSNGSFVAARSLNLGVVGSPLCAEAMAWRVAFDFVVLLGLDSLIMEGDSQQLVAVIPNCSILPTAGQKMASTPGVSATLFNALVEANINVCAIAQGCSEYNITLVVKREDCVRALRAVCSRFYLSRTTIAMGIIGPGLIGSTLLDQLRDQIEYA
ncbi:hypothetical protein RHSIM_Rhsim01G0175900 [Rhododendron simsii]|uniref:aspartate kinase n=1 Tax=Rhododendron simsii TaxID=118357 RepID=A0A834HVT9_RHOSS|nr:hypothetical protein RHSIM_Rhsim01G0175900 [Rhododendron simsii]